MKNIVDMKSLYYFYLGSLNTPPCDGKFVFIVRVR